MFMHPFYPDPFIKALHEINPDPVLVCLLIQAHTETFAMLMTVRIYRIWCLCVHGKHLQLFCPTVDGTLPWMGGALQVISCGVCDGCGQCGLRLLPQHGGSREQCMHGFNPCCSAVCGFATLPLNWSHFEKYKAMFWCVSSARRQQRFSTLHYMQLI